MWACISLVINIAAYNFKQVIFLLKKMPGD